ncbi:MAG: FtsQ-type POTRA domain-containing protein [Elusimicrobiota bacterium]
MSYRRYRPARYRQRVATRSKFRFERRKKATRVFLFLLITGLAGMISWWTYKAATNFIFKSEHFTVRKVEVRGIKNISQSEVLSLLPFRTGDNMFSFNASSVENDIYKCKQELKKVSVGRGWHKIVVDVEERVPVAFVNSGGQRMGIDYDNKPFPLRGRWAKEILPEIVNQNEQERRTILDFVGVFTPRAKDFFSGILKFRLEPMDRVVLDMGDGSRIFWGPFEKAKVESKLKNLLRVIEDSKTKYESLEYVNLSFFDDGRILVKPKASAAKVFGANKY